MNTVCCSFPSNAITNGCAPPFRVSLEPPGVDLATVLKPRLCEFREKFLEYPKAPPGRAHPPVEFPHKSLWCYMYDNYWSMRPRLQTKRHVASALRIVYSDLRHCGDTNLPFQTNGWCRVFYDDAVLAANVSKLIEVHEQKTKTKTKSTSAREWRSAMFDALPPTWMLNLLQDAAYVGHWRVVKRILEALRTMPWSMVRDSRRVCLMFGRVICCAMLFDGVVAPMVLKDTTLHHRVLASVMYEISTLLGYPHALPTEPFSNSAGRLPFAIVGTSSARTLRRVLDTISVDSFHSNADSFATYSLYVMKVFNSVLQCGQNECIECAVEWIHDINRHSFNAQPWENDECAWASPLAVVFLTMLASISLEYPIALTASKQSMRLEDLSTLLSKLRSPSAATTGSSRSPLLRQKTVVVPAHLCQWLRKLIERGEPFTIHNATVKLFQNYAVALGVALYHVQCVLGIIPESIQSRSFTDPDLDLALDQLFDANGTTVHVWLPGRLPAECTLLQRSVIVPIRTASNDTRDIELWPLLEMLADHTHSPTYGKWSRRKHWRIFRKYTTFVETVLLALRYVADANPAIDMPPELTDIVIGLAIEDMDKSRWHTTFTDFRSGES